MTINWTDPQNDKILLVKILETSHAKFDAKAIAAAWPADEKPTRRAIIERISKLRNSHKAAGTTNESISSNGRGSAESTPASTPAKNTSGGRAKGATSTVMNAGKAATKRKRETQSLPEATAEDFESEGNEISASKGDGSPSKKKSKGSSGRVAVEAVGNKGDLFADDGYESGMTLHGGEEPNKRHHV